MVQVQIWASNKVDKEERSFMGKWDVQSVIKNSSELNGPEKSGREHKVPRHIKFAFKNPVRCRIIWITLRLQRPGSSSVNLENNFNLLSLEENPFAKGTRRTSFEGSAEIEPCLHAKRILVVGSPIRKEVDIKSQQSPAQLNLKGWLERAPQLNRFKVGCMFPCLILCGNHFVFKVHFIHIKHFNDKPLLLLGSS